MKLSGTVSLLLLLLWRPCEGMVEKQSYDEGLKLKHLPDGRVIAHFEHVMHWKTDLSYISDDNMGQYWGGNTRNAVFF